MQFKRRVFALLLLMSIKSVDLFAADIQTIQLKQNVQTPVGTLVPGFYKFSIEDRMPGRAIVRISGPESDTFLLLAAPSPGLAANAEGLYYFDAAKTILRAWGCTGCPAALEFVYPKAEAAKVVADTGESALAADPVFDKLPANLSADDMKVVTLWLLSPQRISGHRGVGLRAVKYSKADAASSTLPATAGNTYMVAIVGLLSTLLSLMMKIAPMIGRRVCVR